MSIKTNIYKSVKEMTISFLRSGTPEVNTRLKKLQFGEALTILHRGSEDKVIITREFFNELVEMSKLSFEFQSIVDANIDVLLHENTTEAVPVYRNQVEVDHKHLNLLRNFNEFINKHHESQTKIT